MNTGNTPDIGKIWPGWKVSEYIGEGAFGKVYKIVRKEFGHVYESALKVITIPSSKGELTSILNDGYDEESAAIYFRGMVEDITGEFMLMSKLRGNSNVVSYEDHIVIPHEGSIGWDIYLRMELLTPLFQYMKENPLSVKDVIRLGINICQALEMCRKYNIIHRDIKPENIFVSGLGQFKLGDFGIARKLEKTSSGLSKKGTYGYMAPEVYHGDEYNATVDIYSLGIVLYRFLNNNRLPFLPPYPKQIHYLDRDEANLRRFSGEPLEPPCNAGERLSEIVLKACAYRPQDRFGSAGQMRGLLQEIFDSGEDGELNSSFLEKLENEENVYAFSSHYEDKIDILPMKDMALSETDIEKTQGLFSNQSTWMQEKRGEEERREREKKAEEERREKERRIEEERRERERKAEEERKERERKEKEKTRKEEKLRKEEKKKERQHEKEKVAEEKQKKRAKKEDGEDYGRKKFLAAAVVGLAAIAIVFLVEVKKDRWTEVPDLRNMSMEQAEKLAEDSGLTVFKEAELYSDTIERGHIISQDLEVGSSVKKDSVIAVKASLGKEMTEIPSVELLGEEAGLLWEIQCRHS